MERTLTNTASPEAGDAGWMGLYRLSGILLILTAVAWFVVSRTARMLYAAGYPGDPVSYLQLVSQHQLLASATWGLWIVSDFLLIPPTVALYLVLRRYNRTIALVGSMFAMFFNVYDVCVTELNSLTLVTLSQGYASTSSDTLRAALVGAAAYGYYALPIQTVLSFAIGSLGYLLWCIVMVKSFFPRWMGIFGAMVSIEGILGAAAPIFPSSFLLGFLQYICVPLMALWFISIGVQLYRYGHSFPASAGTLSGTARAEKQPV